MFTTEQRDAVTLVRMEHGKVNAMDTELMTAWVGVLGRLERADGTAAVVLTGTGSVFSAGVDLRRLMDGGRDYVRSFLPLLGDAFFRTFTFPKPLVAAINGHAIAGGCILACACDYRVMAESGGRIGTPELSVGVPFPGMALEILRLAVPPHRLQSAIYGGLTCTPPAALAAGFVDELAPPDACIDRAVAFAARLGALPPVSFALTKRLIRGPSRDRVVAGLRSIDEEVLQAWLSPRVLDAVQSYVDRTLRK